MAGEIKYSNVEGLGIEKLLTITFHRSRRVQDHENPSIQPITTIVPHSNPCILTDCLRDGPEELYLLAVGSSSNPILVHVPILATSIHG